MPHAHVEANAKASKLPRKRLAQHVQATADFAPSLGYTHQELNTQAPLRGEAFETPPISGLHRKACAKPQWLEWASAWS